LTFSVPKNAGSSVDLV